MPAIVLVLGFCKIVETNYRWLCIKSFINAVGGIEKFVYFFTIYLCYAEVTFSCPVLGLENKRIKYTNMEIQDGVYLISVKQLHECDSLDLLKLYSTV